MIISSFFEGRVRLKAPLFKNNDICNEISNILLNTNGVENVTINNTTGSILIEYNPVKIPLLKIKKAMPYFEKIKEMYVEYEDEAIADILLIIKEMEKLFK